MSALTLSMIFTALLLAYANGANDNFKGVASLFGSRTSGYRTAISWATLTTFAGSLTAMFMAQALLKRFAGQGLVPTALAASPQFILSVGLGAGATVLLAALLGFPISTTHGLTGALVGAGFIAVGDEVHSAQLGKAFVLPLLVSPLLAATLGATVYLASRFARLRLGVTREMCVCVGVEQSVLPLPRPDGVFATQALPTPSAAVAEPFACTQRYKGQVFGVNAGRLLDTLHFLSAGAVSFARGLNDTPKIAALLLAAGSLDIQWGFAAVAVAIAVGGLFNAKKVAETMSHRLTGMNPGQGFAANLTTALLVTTASFNGLPVSTTHVSVGSLLGMGIATHQVKWKPVLGVLASWAITLPCGALLAALIFFALSAIL
jgi:PiT family inorganic phosphate transporter